jgi:orotate phosphoribosyltransferase-like protein
MFRFLVVLAVIASSVAFMPTRMGARRVQIDMSLESFQAKISKAVGIAALGVALAGPVLGPMPAVADGAVSSSTVYRTRLNYGTKLLNLTPAVQSGNFAAFEDKKTLNAFDLFISGSNAKKGIADKERKLVEKDLQAKIYTAVKAKDTTSLNTYYNEFIKVADLKSLYKPGDLGQTDSSGNSPTWGTDRQYIYQR